LSGGQRQRVDIARAIALNPQFVIADEPVTSLDASISSQIVNLLEGIKEEFGITYLWISHDLTTVRYVSNRVVVLYLGRVMELAKKEDLFADPSHPYTQALLSAVPDIDPTKKSELIRLRGEMPSPINLPSGCVFHTRCPFADEKCIREEPKLTEIATDHLVACHYANAIKSGLQPARQQVKTAA
jgi:oligopeptide/dipeptide ABC transporter ATP-binding protein